MIEGAPLRLLPVVTGQRLEVDAVDTTTAITAANRSVKP